MGTFRLQTPTTCSPASARAQWIIYDPANTVQSVINTAQKIAKFIEMINYQVQQIRTLTDQLDESKHS
ncbi:MAG: DUF4141 domain-containing protein [Verrucomicrobia bacterium]|nr:DUF4141 domain-containing protein [Verrucomicrobiota bacterium]